ncbi:MAG: lipoyl(octanoyl) transferase LipB [Thermoleophilia bacterium]|nr:lipoyl(octanoyl) transferase LipB [Thermoleophilia bacterium]
MLLARATSMHYRVFDLGLAPYLPVQKLQQGFRQAVTQGTVPGVVLLLEHPPTVTLGKRADPAVDLRDAEELRRRKVAVVRSERGGRATAHAPGQLVVYPVVPIPRRDLRAYVYGLEEMVRLVLERLGLQAHRRPGFPGLYVQEKKIASVGLRCERWVASHGISLNVNVELDLFDLIVSCGEADLRQTSLQAFTGNTYSMDEIKTLCWSELQSVFGWKLDPPVRTTLQEAMP